MSRHDEAKGCGGGGCGGGCHQEAPSAAPEQQEETEGASRRAFLTQLGLAAAAVLTGCTEQEREEFLRKQFKELTPTEVADRVAHIKADIKTRYGKDATVSTVGPIPGVTFGYGLDLSRCIGCRRCEYACVKENNQSRDPQLHWIRVLEMEKERGIDLERANPYYDPATVPDPDHFYVPVACQQCANSPCMRVCPVGATWHEPDGIVVIDYDWCIGCRSCMAACPYGARHFNWGNGNVPAEELNTNMHIYGNRPRPRGVVEKCTWCVQRTREGRYPACVEICPVGARKFGDLNDPQSEISRILKEKRVFVLKSELRTEPKFFYFYGL
jgi:molybdopterin-containing oxidoreductase family iron-sulfur binding subunit